MSQITNKDGVKQVEQCLDLLREVLKKDLLGVYLYGSSLTGGLHKYSDIDIFAVSNRATTLQEKEVLAKSLLKISGIYGVSENLWPIELTIVVLPEINPWKYPPKFDFQYGDWMRKDFEAGNFEPWETKEMPNLALVITQILLISKNLYGKLPNRLLSLVPYQDFIHASVREIDSLMSDLGTDTRNVLLTLARIWLTAETNTIGSKQFAAEEAIKRLPTIYKLVMQRALSICLGESEEYWEDLAETIKPCTEHIIVEIKQQIKLVEMSDHSNKSITLAE
jgi:streptomycin 3"-adenylyltransferase